MYKGTKPFFQKGPIFTNIVLADELNRGSPKSQSAFMEAMEEKSVTIDGNTYELPAPFFCYRNSKSNGHSGNKFITRLSIRSFHGFFFFK